VQFTPDLTGDETKGPIREDITSLGITQTNPELEPLNLATRLNTGAGIGPSTEPEGDELDKDLVCTGHH